MKKYSILALALVLCVTGLTGCRRNKGLADGTIPTTTATTAATYPTTMPSSAATSVPPSSETRPQDTTMDTQEGMTNTTSPSGNSRSRGAMSGVG